MKEQFSYRARKWLLQRISSSRRSNQLQRLTNTNWDILVILDACGVAALQSVTEWPVETVVSPASCTPEWLETVDDAGVFEESHVVSANAQYDKTDPSATLERYWETHWDETLSTVRPEPILDRVGEIVPEQQAVAHLQQPHWPYVAKLGDSWKLAYRNLGPWETDAGETESLQVAMARGCIDISTASQAYLASVASVWQTLLPYLEQWDERSLTVVVTADHGETFGRVSDGFFYEHPCGCHIPPLTNVPWVHISQSKHTNSGSDTVEDRLKALGYAE